MASTPNAPRPGRRPRALDPSMKARQAEIFEEQESLAARGAVSSVRSFAEHLRDTPAEKLPTIVLAGLYLTAAIVGILFLASLFRLTQPRKPRPEATSGAVGHRPVEEEFLSFDFEAGRSSSASSTRSQSGTSRS